MLIENFPYFKNTCVSCDNSEEHPQNMHRKSRKDHRSVSLPEEMTKDWKNETEEVFIPICFHANKDFV